MGHPSAPPPPITQGPVWSSLLTAAIPVCLLAAKVRGWWWIRDPEEVKALLQALHCRGIREKALHKHLSKHMEFLSDVCSRPSGGKELRRECFLNHAEAGRV